MQGIKVMLPSEFRSGTPAEAGEPPEFPAYGQTDVDVFETAPDFLDENVTGLHRTKGQMTLEALPHVRRFACSGSADREQRA